MPVTILAFYHIKGGVGKTAATVNMAYLAAQSGAPTLLCDLDPQGAATYYFRVEPNVKAATKVFTQGGKHITRNIKATDYDHLDLLPSDLSHRHLTRALENVNRPKRRLRAILAPLFSEYQYIMLDCPPTLTLLAEAIFTAVDRLILPVVPSTLAQQAYEQLQVFFHKKHYDPDKILPFFSMVEKHKIMHRQTMQALWDQDSRFLHHVIPYLADIEKMGLHRAPVAAFAPHSGAAQAYQRVWEECQRRFDAAARTTHQA
jgi:cellulose biosynthesis protein BcsQ